MSFNDISEPIRTTIIEEIDCANDYEYVAGLMLDAANEDSDYDKSVEEVLTEALGSLNLEIRAHTKNVRLER